MSRAVDRFVFAKLVEAEVAGRATLAATVRAALTAAIGADGEVTVGLPADASARRWDLAIVVRVRDLAGWEVLAARPAVAALMRDLEARAEVVKAWTFTVE
ncbi:MAG: hypothetical protein KBG28_10690 [Kofleriaceae bacterium]|jgi:hypothetical protein|nr:hypothetical protein [Kofleriaceae bacterium]MBP6839025.1 hypothetical protein [Kofleriaceae bacterium]MBP9204423.1 hypothetical protein [Kofleriaceae bacterium]